MNADDFAEAVHALLPKECPRRTRDDILAALFVSAAIAVDNLKPDELDETERAMYGRSSDNGT